MSLKEIAIFNRSSAEAERLDAHNSTSKPKQKDCAEILVVDNDPAILKLLGSYLESIGVHVCCAQSGLEALSIAKQREFALMIVDVRMPVMDGFEFASKVRETLLGKSTPIIFVSAAVYDSKLLRYGYQFGAVDFMLKPVQPEVLKCKAKIFVKLYEQKKSAETSAKELERVNNSLRETKLALEDALFESKSNENYFRSVFESTGDAVLLVRADNRIVNANAAAKKLVGYSESELIGMNINVLFPYDSNIFRLNGNDTSSVWQLNIACHTKNGSLLSTDVAVAKLPAAGRRQLLVIVQDRTEKDRLREQADYLNSELKSQSGFEFIIGKSKGIQEILEKVKLVAPTEATVLITGESGSGKELIARAIHESSPVREGNFVRVNCGSIPNELFESEFFGHVKGAFTGAIKDRLGRFDLAHGGTLFLDEVGEIPASCQAKLLRVLQDKEFERVGEGKTRKTNARLIAATNRDLKADVEKGLFRKDLYYRLNTFPIEVPPLRERLDDIPLLAQHFANLACERFRRPKMRLSDSQVAHLLNYSWPGNVRELQQVVDRAVILGSNSSLVLERLSDVSSCEPIQENVKQPAEARIEKSVKTYSELKELEKQVVINALERCDWKVYGDDGAAQRLGIKPTTLNSKLKKMGIERPHSHSSNS